MPRKGNLLASAAAPPSHPVEPPVPQAPESAEQSYPAALPTHLVELLKTLPPHVDRRNGAAQVKQHLFPVSHRTLEAWRLPTQHVNGRALIPTRALFEAAYAKLTAAPVIMGGRRAKAPPLETPFDPVSPANQGRQARAPAFNRCAVEQSAT